MRGEDSEKEVLWMFERNGGSSTYILSGAVHVCEYNASELAVNQRSSVK